MGDTLTVRAYEANDTGAGEGLLGYRTGRILGSGTTSAGQGTQRETDSAIAVIGDWDYGLREYQEQTPPPGDWPPSAHDRVVVVNGVRSAQMPDRWQGLAAFDALVWGRGTGAYDPGSLTPEQAGAIEEWVKRGGHLIVVLPTTGQEWTGQASNRLRGLLPAMGAPVRHEGVNLEAYRWLLIDRGRPGARAQAVLPGSVVVHELVPAADASEGACTVVLNGPAIPGVTGGWPLVVRRTVGSGAVSVIGVDLSVASLRASGAPDVETFWHRVLGRRGEFLTQAELDAGNAGNAARSRDPVYFDDDIAGAIAKSGSAAQGVLLGLVLFVAYWLIAGPVGFAFLAKSGRKHLAWPAFLAAIGVFTAIAWTGAAALRPKRVNGTHVTYLEQVAGQDMQRARSWVSVLIPRYGEDTIAVEGEGNLIAPWEESDTALGGLQTFPDNRSYRIEARAPSEMSPPTRQTVKQVQVDWAGAERWGMIHAVGVQPGDPPTIGLAKDELRNRTYVKGALEHGMPAALKGVLVVLVERQQTVRASPVGNDPIALVRAWSPTGGEWEPGERLNLEQITSPNADESTKTTAPWEFLGRMLEEGRDRSHGVGSRGDLEGRLTAVRFFSQLAPGEPLLPKGERRVARRTASQGWDLGRWFTQPCLIVVGIAEVDPSDASVEASPIPLTVDGRAVPMSGRTVVTWIYPLPSDPPEFNPLGEWAPGEGDAGAEGAPAAGETSEDEG